MDRLTGVVSPIVVAAADELAAAIVAGALAQAGYPVVVARHGAEVHALVARHRPRVLVLDVHPSRRTGYELLRALDADPSRSSYRVLAVGTSARMGVADEMRRAGADDFLSRPFAPRELVARVDRLYTPEVVAA